MKADNKNKKKNYIYCPLLTKLYSSTPTSPQALHNLQQAIARWQLVLLAQPFSTHTSVLQKVLAHGKPAFLKVALCEEECRGAAVLRWWNGEGAVQVWAHHKNVILLECATGSRSLAAMSHAGQDAEASRIVCAVAARLHAQSLARLPKELPTALANALPEKLPKELHGITPLSQWFQDLFIAEKTHGGFFLQCAKAAHILLEAQQDIVVLHGDLHHNNILDAGKRGWLAIDPKGLLGERGFDYANLFCNPDYPTATQPGRFAAQVHLVSEAAQLQPKRLLAWVAAWAGLSAIWHLGAAENADTALHIGELALQALRA